MLSLVLILPITLAIGCSDAVSPERQITQSTRLQVSLLLFQRLSHVCRNWKCTSHISRLGLYRNKAKFLKKCAQQLLEHFDGQVPRTARWKPTGVEDRKAMSSKRWLWKFRLLQWTLMLSVSASIADIVKKSYTPQWKTCHGHSATREMVGSPPSSHGRISVIQNQNAITYLNYDFSSSYKWKLMNVFTDLNGSLWYNDNKNIRCPVVGAGLSRRGWGSILFGRTACIHFKSPCEGDFFWRFVVKTKEVVTVICQTSDYAVLMRLSAWHQRFE